MKKSIAVFLFLCFLQGGFNSYAQIGTKKNDAKFVYETSLGFSMGVGDIRYEKTSVSNKNPLFQVNQVLAYQFNKNFYMGVGAGLNVWKYTAFIPLYLNLSVNMTKAKIAPHWYINMGYSFKWYDESRPEKMTKVIHGAGTGPFGETGLGVKVGITDRVSILVMADYIAQLSTLKYSVVSENEVDFSAYSTNRSTTALYHFVGIKVAVFY